MKGVNMFALGTAMGSWGGFLPAPMWFKHLTSTLPGQFFALYVLIWQGGAQHNIMVALKTAALLFVGGMVIDKIYKAVVPAERQFVEGMFY